MGSCLAHLLHGKTQKKKKDDDRRRKCGDRQWYEGQESEPFAGANKNKARTPSSRIRSPAISTCRSVAAAYSSLEVAQDPAGIFSRELRFAGIETR